jgi:hypothetical protein
MWILLKQVQTLPLCPTGSIVDLLSDNTSVLSWRKLTATIRDPCLQPIARFASTFLVTASQHLTRVQSRHIPGKGNVEADLLSRSKNGRIPYVGLHYSAMLPMSDVLDMPTPARTAVLDGRANFLRIDRGHVRGARDATADSRLLHFASWLESKRYDQQSASRIPADLAIDLIGTYLKSVCSGALSHYFDQPTMHCH